MRRRTRPKENICLLLLPEHVLLLETEHKYHFTIHESDPAQHSSATTLRWGVEIQVWAGLGSFLKNSEKNLLPSSAILCE